MLCSILFLVLWAIECRAGRYGCYFGKVPVGSVDCIAGCHGRSSPPVPCITECLNDFCEWAFKPWGGHCKGITCDCYVYLPVCETCRKEAIEGIERTKDHIDAVTRRRLLSLGEPTRSPSTDPTISPSTDPTISPSTDPTISPSTDPTGSPSTDPTGSPSTDPTGSPTTDPTRSPTTNPTDNPIDDDFYCLASDGCRYFYIDIELTYEDARTYCRDNFDTDLATINTKDDIQAALDISEGHSVWIGLRSTHRTGWFEWEDNYEGYHDCPDRYSGACIDFWEIGHPHCVIDKNGRTEFEHGYQGEGYSFTTFNGNGKIDNNIPQHTKREFLCNGVRAFEDSPECPI